jgi:hypothetical protein
MNGSAADSGRTSSTVSARPCTAATLRNVASTKLARDADAAASLPSPPSRRGATLDSCETKNANSVAITAHIPPSRSTVHPWEGDLASRVQPEVAVRVSDHDSGFDDAIEVGGVDA